MLLKRAVTYPNDIGISGHSLVTFPATPGREETGAETAGVNIYPQLEKMWTLENIKTGLWKETIRASFLFSCFKPSEVNVKLPKTYPLWSSHSEKALASYTIQWKPSASGNWSLSMTTLRSQPLILPGKGWYFITCEGCYTEGPTWGSVTGILGSWELLRWKSTEFTTKIFRQKVY